MKVSIRSFAVAIGVFALTSSLTAFQGQGMHRNMRMYDRSAETTFKGTVQDVTQPARGPMTGTHLSVRTEDGVVPVALGPASFIAAGDFTFAKGDSVEITGSKVTVNGERLVIAREVVKDARTLTLRDKDGNPKWSRGMMRQSAPAKQ